MAPIADSSSLLGGENTGTACAARGLVVFAKRSRRLKCIGTCWPVSDKIVIEHTIIARTTGHFYVNIASIAGFGQ
jgi:hypothetical protein